MNGYRSHRLVPRSTKRRRPRRLRAYRWYRRHLNAAIRLHSHRPRAAPRPARTHRAFFKSRWVVMERVRAWARGDVASATSKGIGSILGDIFRLQRMLAVGAGQEARVSVLPDHRAGPAGGRPNAVDYLLGCQPKILDASATGFIFVPPRTRH
jgi:hypothetical protein